MHAISLTIYWCRLMRWSKHWKEIFIKCYSSFKKLEHVWVFIHLWRSRKIDLWYIKTSPKLPELSHTSMNKSSCKATFHGDYFAHMNVCLIGCIACYFFVTQSLFQIIGFSIFALLAPMSGRTWFEIICDREISGSLLFISELLSFNFVFRITEENF